MAKRVYVVIESFTFRRIVCDIVESEPGLTLVGNARTVEQAGAEIARLGPDLIIVDCDSDSPLEGSLRNLNGTVYAEETARSAGASEGALFLKELVPESQLLLFGSLPGYAQYLDWAGPQVDDLLLVERPTALAPLQDAMRLIRGDLLMRMNELFPFFEEQAQFVSLLDGPAPLAATRAGDAAPLEFATVIWAGPQQTHQLVNVIKDFPYHPNSFILIVTELSRDLARVFAERCAAYTEYVYIVGEGRMTARPGAAAVVPTGGCVQVLERGADLQTCPPPKLPRIRLSPNKLAHREGVILLGNPTQEMTGFGERMRQRRARVMALSDAAGKLSLVGNHTTDPQVLSIREWYWKITEQRVTCSAVPPVAGAAPAHLMVWDGNSTSRHPPFA
ncbi:MAG: hypothetical protein KDA60_20520, partial [Planctomycetales bacterium]|nr:hypothetical protein [Planctomycetales bacterium]